jgi:2-oxoglutarate dehydrogenase E2 component (dihydrolipoamide succinyltransferase)
VSSSVRATTVVEVDVTPLVRLDDRLTVFLARAAIEAVREHPEFNAATFNVAAEAGRQAAIHLTVATDTPQGPRVSVIRDAGDLNLSGLARRIGERVDDPRAGIVPPQQGTFTLADSASRDVLFDTPILPPGQIAILGTGAVVERPVVMRRTDGEAVIAIRSMVYLALTYDARLVEAVAAARFLTTVRAWLTKDPHAAQ